MREIRDPHLQQKLACRSSDTIRICALILDEALMMTTTTTTTRATQS
jgi:hypothetical protein